MTEWYKHEQILNLAIKSIWEKIGREVDKKIFIPKAVVHISANMSPDKIKLIDANESKVKFIASGSKALAHPSKLKLCREMQEYAFELRKYLPVILGLGVECILPEINDEHLQEYVGILKTDYDEREGKPTCIIVTVYFFIIP